MILPNAIGARNALLTQTEPDFFSTEATADNHEFPVAYAFRALAFVYQMPDHLTSGGCITNMPPLLTKVPQDPHATFFGEGDHRVYTLRHHHGRWWDCCFRFG
jgi:hypothetical protein